MRHFREAQILARTSFSYNYPPDYIIWFLCYVPNDFIILISMVAYFKNFSTNTVDKNNKIVVSPGTSNTQ